jgi:hypothetical protein
VNAPSTTLPSREEGERFRRRLLGGDEVAQSEFIVAYLKPLVGWLRQRYRAGDEDFYQQAAEDALIGFIHTPESHDPARCRLWGYLCTAARGDLLNLLAREAKHRRGVPAAHAARYAGLLLPAPPPVEGWIAKLRRVL